VSALRAGGVEPGRYQTVSERDISGRRMAIPSDPIFIPRDATAPALRIGGTLRAEARARVQRGDDGAVLTFEGRVRNDGDEPLVVAHAGAPVRISAHGPDGAVWREVHRQDHEPRVRGATIPGIPRWNTLAAGDAVGGPELSRRIPVRRVLGDSLPPGRYMITAGFLLHAGTLEARTGPVMLARPRHR